jgi:hypothetical protein
VVARIASWPAGASARGTSAAWARTSAALVAEWRRAVERARGWAG